MTFRRPSLVLAAGASFVLASGLGAAFADTTSTPIQSEAAIFSLAPQGAIQAKACMTVGTPNGVQKIKGTAVGPFMAAASSDSTPTTDPRLNGTGVLTYTVFIQPDRNGVMDGHLTIFQNPSAPTGPKAADGTVQATFVMDTASASDTSEFMDGFMLLRLFGQPASGGSPALPAGQLYANFASTTNVPSSTGPIGLSVFSGKLGDTTDLNAGRDDGPTTPGLTSWSNHRQNNAAMFIPDSASC